MCLLSFAAHRSSGLCVPCPNTAWLLFLMFAIVLSVLVVAAVYLSRKRLNLAGLGIGLVSTLIT